MDTPKFKRGQKIELWDAILTVQHVRYSAMLHECIYTINNMEIPERMLLDMGAKPAQDGTQ